MPKSSYPGRFDPAEEKLHALLGSASFVIGRSTLQTVGLQQRRSVRMARRRSRRGLI
jgi:hypothetical protein